MQKITNRFRGSFRTKFTFSSLFANLRYYIFFFQESVNGLRHSLRASYCGYHAHHYPFRHRLSSFMVNASKCQPLCNHQSKHKVFLGLYVTRLTK